MPGGVLISASLKIVQESGRANTNRGAERRDTRGIPMQTVPESSNSKDSESKAWFKFTRPADAVVLLVLIACLGAVGLQAATQITSFDPPAATVGNARLLLLAVTQYTQDYDEQLPPASSTAVFDAALRPYVPDPAVFVSRVTGKPFVPNAAVGGQSLASFSDPSTVAVFQDVLPPSKVPDTVGFLDGHVERGGVIQGDPKLLSYGNAKSLAIGVIEYTQDNDEILPPTNTQAAFQTALLPYVRNSHLFVDPLNGKPFLPNPALSQVPLYSISDPHAIILLQSQMPYQNGVPTVAYVDDHVTPTPPMPPGQSDASNLKQLGLATIQYAQDCDEKLPTTTDYGTFESELLPYANNAPIFASPGTGLPYVLNPAISGASLASIASPSATEEARDAQLNADGTLNHLELDGSVQQDTYFVPKALAIGPDNLTRLLWPSAGPQTALWTFAAGGPLQSAFSSVGPAVSFSVGADNQTRVLEGESNEFGYSSFLVTGESTLETLDADNSVQDTQTFGPYDGWTALFVATAPDNSSRLLWQRYDGTLALWTLSLEGDFLGSVTLPPLTGGTVLGLGQGADGSTRLLWKTAGGDATLRVISRAGRVLRSFTARASGGFVPTALGFGADGTSRILSSNGAGKAAVQTVPANGKPAAALTFTLPGGGTAAQIAVGSAGDLRVLWEAPDGSGTLLTLTPQGVQTSVQALAPYR